MSRRLEKAIQSEQERFWSWVYKEPGENACWLWEGNQNTGGYGQISITRVSNNTKHPCAHRYAYEISIGPIPLGLTLDHLCRVRTCVRPSHLEPVSIKENVLRGISWAAKNSRKAACSMGHVFIAKTTYVTKAGSRQCRICHAARQLLRKQKLKEANL